MKSRSLRYCWSSCVAFLLLTQNAPAQINSHAKTRNFDPSDEIFANPECGFYSVEETGLKRDKIAQYEPLTLERLQQIRAERSLVFRYFGLKEWRTRELTIDALRKIDNDFGLIRKTGLKCIIRFAYSANIGEPDAPLSIVLRHLDQLAPIIRKNKDVIAVMQAGFIGAWGEWHSSTNNHESVEHMRIILHKVLEVLPRDRMTQLRTPKYKQSIFSLKETAESAVPLAQAFGGSPISRVGHHNDCFLANESDMGTYMRSSFNDTAAAKAYLLLENRFVPMGGETCQPSIFSDCGNALRELKRLHWSFLNGQYDERVLADFTAQGCIQEMARKLGYRFALLDARFTSVTTLKGQFHFTARLVNSGWASPYNKRDVELVIRHVVSGRTYSAKLQTDPRLWLSGDTVVISAAVGIPSAMEKGEYSLFLNLPDPEPRLRNRSVYSIRLANKGIWEASTGYNHLADSVIVQRFNSANRSYQGSHWFRPSSQ